MEFITLPVIYTKVKKSPPMSAQDQSHRSVLEELGIESDDEEDEVEFREVFDNMHIQLDTLKDVLIAPFINPDGSITPDRAVMEFGKLSGRRRVVIEVNMPVGALLVMLNKVA